MTQTYRGYIKKIKETPGAIVITQQGLDLLGRSDRRIYLPKSQIKIRKDDLHGYEIFIPEWLIIKNRINWNRLEEIEPIDPPRSKILISKEENSWT